MKTETLARFLLFPLAFAMTLALAPARSSYAQVPGGDVDGDGVLDVDDQCPDTDLGDLVGADGCSLCPCNVASDGSEWTSHKEYVACVSAGAKSMKHTGLLTRKAMRDAVKRAKKSTCGSNVVTRCCVYTNLSSDADVIMGKCRMITPDECDGLSLEVDDAEDIGPGSCLPNPCEF